MAQAETPEPHILYWVLTAGVMALAVFSAASIGLFILVLGLTMLVRGVRGRPRHGFWPPIIGFVLFFAAFNLVGHLVGLLSSGPRMTVGQATAPGIIPSLWLSILAAVAVGFVGAYLARIALLRLARRNQLTRSQAP